MKCYNSVGKTFVSQDCKAKQNPCTAQEGPTQPWLLLSQSLGCFHLWPQQPRDELRGSQEMLAKGRRQQEPQGKRGPKAELLCPPSSPCPSGEAGLELQGCPRVALPTAAPAHTGALLPDPAMLLDPGNSPIDYGLNGELVWQPLA